MAVLPLLAGDSLAKLTRFENHILKLDSLFIVNQEAGIVRRRFNATKKVAWESRIKSNPAWNIEVVEVLAEGESLLARMMSCALLGDLVSLKLAEMNDVEATPVTVIENLKTELDGK